MNERINNYMPVAVVKRFDPVVAKIWSVSLVYKGRRVTRYRFTVECDGEEVERGCDTWSNPITCETAAALSALRHWKRLQRGATKWA